MEALLVVLAVLLVIRLVGLVVLIPADQPPGAAPGPPRHTDPCLAPLMALTPPSNPERDLVEDLTAGRIRREQYRAAMAELAERDALAHPLPPPTG